VTQPLVHRRVHVAHLVTGGELVAPDHAPAIGQIRDSNSTLIAALLLEAGADLCWHKRVADARHSTAAALAEALASPADIILISGGASVGDHDHTGSLLAEFGFTLHCDKVDSRPGKPFIAASREGRLAFGLPGNPLAHFVCFHLFVKRVLARLAGNDPEFLIRAKLNEDALIEQNPRETWWPAYLSYSRSPMRSSSLVVTPLPWRDSSDLTVLARADALVRIPAGGINELEVEVLSCR
jgi:molybdopterin molybdotransferase